MSEQICVERHGTIVSLIMNRPAQKNALSIAILREFCHLLSREITADTSAVIVTGSRECFSAGADLSDLQGTIEDLVVDDAIAEAVNAIRSLPVPVIAAIDGPCLGAAVDLSTACDLRVASEQAYFQVPAARLGLLYNPASVARMYKCLPHDALTRLLILGEKLDAKEAWRIGLVTHLAESQGSHELALSIARNAKDNVLSAVAASKGLLNALASDQYDAAKWNEVRCTILSSPERREAIEKAKQARKIRKPR
jgi:enoyl-CoA hydratase/carnithine racemase